MLKKKTFRFSRILLPALAAFLALCCAGCSSSTPSIPGQTGGYNTKENLALFRESSLYPLAEGWRAAADGRRSPVSTTDGSEAEAFTWHTPVATTPAEPFLAVSVRTGTTSGAGAEEPEWTVIGGTAKQMDLPGVRTLAVCVITTRHKTYQEVGSSRIFTGSAEDADILYIDVASRDIVGRTEIRGRDLPAGYVGSVPHYTQSADDLVRQVRSDLTVPFMLSESGEITGGTLDGRRDGYLFPATVKKITKLEIRGEIETLTIPASVEEIAADAFPRDTVKLYVQPGTGGESFARENGFLFRYPDDGKTTKAPWRICVAGCDCTAEDATPPPALQPDGPLAGIMQRRILVVEEGSAAQAYAREHQLLYRFEGGTEMRFCIGGQDWIIGRGIAFVPDNVTAEDEMLAWIKKKNYPVITTRGSAAEAACRQAGLVCWYGDYDLAERTFTDEGGLAWTVVFSFRANAVRAVHIPAGYRQEGRVAHPLDSLLRDIGMKDASRDEMPLCYVQPGSWAAEHIPGRLEEGSTVLHSPVKEQYTEYALDRVTEVVDGETDDRLLDRGVRFLKTQGYDTSWYRAADHPDKMYLIAPDKDRWHLNNDTTLADVRVLKIRGDVTDREELDRILERAGRDLPFVLEVERGTGIAAFAQEHGIPFVYWEWSGRNFYDGNESNAASPALPAGPEARSHTGWHLAKEDYFRYVVLEDDTAEIVEWTGDTRELEVPATLDGHTVTAIADRVFRDRDRLVRVTLPDTIRSIGPNPFADCGALEAIIVSPDHPYLAVENDVLYTRPEGRLVCCVRPSAPGSFTIPEGIRSIGAFAFNRCSNLDRVDIPKTVTAIEPCAFYGCYGLEALSVPAGVKEIGNGAFADCYFLSGVSIAGSGVSIGEYAFGNCVSLGSIDLPEQAAPRVHAFDRCLRLKRVTVPGSVAFTDGNPFTGCAAPEEIVLSPDHPSLMMEGGALFSRPDRTLIIPACTPETEAYTVPEGTARIGAGAFEGCGLSAVQLPAGLEAICNSAFRSCPRLAAVTVPAGTAAIGADAFSGCAALEKVSLPEGLVSIGDRAFFRCAALGEINLPESLETIGDSAFRECDSLPSLAIPRGVSRIGEEAFSGCNALTLRIVQGSYTEEYLKDNPRRFVYQPTGELAWLGGPVREVPATASAEGAKTAIADGFTYIPLADGTAEIRDCPKGRKELEIPSELDGLAVTAIADKALEKSAVLETVTIPDSVLRVGVNPFCQSDHLRDIIVSPNHPTLVSMDSVLYSKPDKRLVSVPIQFRNRTCIIPDGIRTIGSYAFCYCVGVKKLEIPGSVTSIEEYAFRYTRYLDDITMGDGPAAIGDYAFSGCWSVENLVLPKTLKTIGAHAFEQCNSLMELTLPEGLVSIGDYAFGDCRKLRKITIPQSVSSIGKDAFRDCDYLVLTVHEGSFAETWCRQEGVPFTLYGQEATP